MASLISPTIEQIWFEEFVDRTKQLAILYTMLEIEYQKFSSADRHYLDIATFDPICDNARPAHSIVYAKFLLAAILGWSPTQHNFSVVSFMSSDLPIYKPDATNDASPYWAGFFHDYLEAMSLLDGLATHAQVNAAAERLSELLESAEIKAGWCETLVQTVRAASGQAASPTSEAEVHNLWNRFCVQMIQGKGLTETVARAGACNMRSSKTAFGREHDFPTELPIELRGSAHQRVWFPFEMNSMPWMNHAAAVIQQPAAPLREEWFVAPMHSLVQQWRLAYKTTACAHHLSSAFSPRTPCCAMQHVHCAGNSPCRIWGARDCVHVRGGDVCSYEHCKFVDWSRYNVCLPA